VNEFHNLKGKTADVLMMYILNVLHKYKLSDKIIASCGENCNINFGEDARRGTNNVFAGIKTSNLKTKIQGTRCAAHVLYNALQTSSHIPLIDVEATEDKIFHYFHTSLYMVWVEELKEFSDFPDVEYKQILVKTRWLSLQPTITEVISMSLALMSCFLSQ
jgi:hypothetical protein